MKKVSTVRYFLPGIWTTILMVMRTSSFGRASPSAFFLRVLVGTWRLGVKSGLRSLLRQQCSHLWVCVRARWGWWLHEDRTQHGFKVHPGDKAKDRAGHVLQRIYVGSIQARSGCSGLNWNGAPVPMGSWCWGRPQAGQVHWVLLVPSAPWEYVVWVACPLKMNSAFLQSLAGTPELSLGSLA